MADQIPANRYGFTRWLLIRGLGFIYAVAFLSLAHQVMPLIGEGGLLPASRFLEQMDGYFNRVDGSRWAQLPTLFWWGCTDKALQGLAWAGFALAVGVCAGISNAFVLVILWALYLSYVNIGQDFYEYGWESITLEAGFLGIWLCPFLRWTGRDHHPSRLILWFYRWLVFRIMFGAGLIKLFADPCWWDLTCLRHHFETQPIPNPTSWFLHNLPDGIHRGGVVFNHVAELAAPWLLFGPRRWRQTGAFLIVLFQGMLIFSGNLSWLNWLTIVCCIPCFDDRALAWLRRRATGFGRDDSACPALPPAHRTALGMIAGLLICLSYDSIENMIPPMRWMNRSFNGFHLVNTYGAFGSITKHRDEIILLATADPEPAVDANWIEISFRAKPGNVHRRPPIVSPYHYRLDWQMWFAAMQRPEGNPWLMNLLDQILEGDVEVWRLLDGNPFPDGPPVFIRADLYRYRFTRWGREPGVWWEREFLREYVPPLSIDHALLRPENAVH